MEQTYLIPFLITLFASFFRAFLTCSSPSFKEIELTIPFP